MTNILAHPGAGGIPDRSRISPVATAAPESPTANVPERGRRNPSPESLKATYQSSPLLSDAPEFKEYSRDDLEIMIETVELYVEPAENDEILEILYGLKNGRYKLLKTSKT